MKAKIAKRKDANYHPHYVDKKPFFSPKEIIFRSGSSAHVLTISTRAQWIMFFVLLSFVFWCIYPYHLYNQRGLQIEDKNKQIVATRNSYIELVSDFAALHKNIDNFIQEKKIKPSEVLKQQSMVVEDKIKNVVEEKEWVSSEKMQEKVSLTEALLQRDILISERDDLRKEIENMQDVIKEIKLAEEDVFQKVDSLVTKEVGKVKSVFTSINSVLKKKGLYFNALAIGRKTAGKGGTYVPFKPMQTQDKKLNNKISAIFDNIDDYNYYKEVIQYVPIGKPVWSYWVTSHYGTRNDPFTGKKASHKGVDLASMTGNKIKVKAKGKVTRSEYTSGYGNFVEVDHGNGFKTRYGHLNKIYVKKGQYLEFDDVIGEVGSTGRSTGPHLHYEILYQGHDINPMTFIKAKVS